MSWFFKTIFFGFLIGLLGLSISLTHFGLNLEENLGLDLLFKLRGVRQAPPEVIVVSIDKLSADKLNLPNDPSKWPRSLHTRLIENLSTKGASVIAFDLHFSEDRLARDDNKFADAMRKSGNIVLSESLIRKTPVDESGKVIENIYIEKNVPPIPLFTQSAFAVASFPLPKVPLKVSQYWTFKRSSGDTPTLPVVIFQSFASEVYDEFIRLLKKHAPDKTDNLPANKELLVNSKEIKKVITTLKDIFVSQPIIAKRMLEEVINSKTLLVNSRQKNLLKSLIKMYQSPHNLYLNFYGPPRTVTTIPYYQALQLTEKTYSNQTQLNFSQTAVFIGVSENIHSGKKNDSYHTVFSQPNGVDISGVEIAATAFANLLENMPVRPLNFYPYFTIVFFGGLILSIVCRLFPPAISLASVIVMGVLYLLLSLYQFNKYGIWYPLVVPLFIQAPIAFFSAVAWKRIASNRIIKHFLPYEIIRKITGGVKFEEIKSISKKVHGACLITDIAGFTKVSEKMDPEEVNILKQRYFSAVFKSLENQRLLIKKTTGDGIVAVWEEQSDSFSRRTACIAAINIKKAVHRFNQSSNVKLLTRIGLHFGPISLSILGAAGHYEYDLSGDTVNATQRIEELNKSLGTQIMLSEEVLNQTNGFLTREVGQFLLTGKSNPLVIHELIGFLEESDQHQRNLCTFFSEALAAFRRQSWEEASRILKDLMNRFGQDGPSQFYLTLCEQYGQKPPEKSWNEIICMGNK